MKKIILLIYILAINGCGTNGNSTTNIANDENSSNRYIAPLNENINTLIPLEDTFVTRHKKSANIQTIWNLPFKVFDFKKVQKFDIGVNITKDTLLTKGDILIKGISLKNKEIISIDSLTIFGKKASGSTGNIIYMSDFNMTKNSIKIEKDMLVIQLGYIMENQTIVSKKSFKKQANYNVDVYISMLDMNENNIDEEYLLQTEFNTFYTFNEETQKISGLVIIE